MKRILFKTGVFPFVLFACTIIFSGAQAQQDTIFRSFSATQASDGVLISFTIRGGITCTGVRVERSADNSNYSGIYEFSGVCGSSTNDESYSYTDKFPVNNATSWYRLDLGSLGLYSKVVSIKYIKYGDDGALAFPNPCINSCMIYFSNPNRDDHVLHLYDVTGKLVYKTTNEKGEIIIDSSVLGQGLYFYRLLINEEISSTGKLSII